MSEYSPDSWVVLKVKALKKNEQFGGQIQMMDEDTDWSTLA